MLSGEDHHNGWIKRNMALPFYNVLKKGHLTEADGEGVGGGYGSPENFKNGAEGQV